MDNEMRQLEFELVERWPDTSESKNTMPLLPRMYNCLVGLDGKIARNEVQGTS